MSNAAAASTNGRAGGDGDVVMGGTSSDVSVGISTVNGGGHGAVIKVGQAAVAAVAAEAATSTAATTTTAQKRPRGKEEAEEDDEGEQPKQPVEDEQPKAKKAKTSHKPAAAKKKAAKKSKAAEPEPEEVEEEEYEVGDTVLAYHGPLLYKAKVIQKDLTRTEQPYMVHYPKWSSRWDEWVGLDRIMEASPDNLNYMAKLQRKVKTKRGKRGSQKVMMDSDSEDSGEDSDEEMREGSKQAAKKAQAAAKYDVLTVQPDDERSVRWNANIPPALRRQLGSDWLHVTQENQLVPLPREPCVAELLESYVLERSNKTSRSNSSARGGAAAAGSSSSAAAAAAAAASKKKKPSAAEVARDFADGIRTLFDFSLEATLLYPQERLQFNQVMRVEGGGGNSKGVGHAHKLPSAVYGPEHLLRLFVRLPELMTFTDMTEAHVSKLTTQVRDFLRWLARNQVHMLDQYTDVDEAYKASWREAFESAEGNPILP